MMESRRMRWEGYGERRNAYRILAGNRDGKRPLGRPKCKCVDNIKIDLREIEWGGMD
jgi:hypothetical protein